MMLCAAGAKGHSDTSRLHPNGTRPNVGAAMKVSAPAVAAGVCLAALAAVMSLQYEPTADGLYCLSFVDDLLFGTAPFHWIAPGPNFLFPDLFIVLVGRLLGLDGQANFAFFSAIYVVFLFWSLALLTRRWTVAGIATVVFCFPAYAPFSISSPAFHQGVIPLIAIAFALLRKDTRRSALLATAVIAVAVMSDAVAVVQLSAPALAAAAIIYLRFRKVRRLSVISTIMGTALGLLLQHLVAATPFMHQPALGDSLHFDHILKSAVTFIRALPDLHYYIGSVQFVMVVAGLIASLAVLAVPRLSPDGDFLSVTSVALSIIASLLAPVAVGTYVHISLFREQLPSLAFGSLLVAWLLATWISKPAVAAVVAALLLIPFGNSLLSQPWPAPFLARFKRIGSALRKNGYHYVWAEYWFAKPLIQASDDLVLCQAHADFSPYFWMTNAGWCVRAYDEWSRAHAQLVLLQPATAKADIAPIKTIDFPSISARGYVYPWTPQLDERIRRALCTEMKGYDFPLPTVCIR